MFNAKSAPDEFMNQTERIYDAPKLWQISHFLVNHRHTAIILGAGADKKPHNYDHLVSTIFSGHIIDLHHHGVNMGKLTHVNHSSNFMIWPGWFEMINTNPWH